MNRPARTSRRHHAGISLLEMLLVIGLIAAASLLAAAAFSGGMKGTQLRSAVKQIAAELRYPRTHAIATGEPQRFTIDPAGRTWQAPKGHKGTIPDMIDVRFIGAREAQPTAGEGAVMFFADGAATGGRVQLSRDGAAWDIDVAWLTGQVSVTRAGPRP